MPWIWLAGFGFALLLVSPFWFPTPDSVSYLSISRSLGFYGEPRNLGSPHPMYSIGYPALIVPLVRWSPSNPFFLLSLFHAILAIGLLFAVRKWASGLDEIPAALVANLTLANAVVLAIFRRDLSEVAFMPLLMMAVITLQAIRDKLPNPGGKRLLFAAALLFLLVIVRPTGMLFAAGFALVLARSVVQRQIRWAKAIRLFVFVTGPALLALASLMVFEQITAGRSQEISNFDMLLNHRLVEADENLAQRFLEGLRIRISEVGRLTVPGMFGAFASRGNWRDWNLLVYVPVFALVCLGWWKSLGRQTDVLVLTFPFYFLLHAYWPWDQAGRYFAPLLPMLFMCLWHGLHFLRGQRLRLFQILLVLHLAVSLGFWVVREVPRGLQNQRDWPALQALAEIIPTDVQPAMASSDNTDAGLILAWMLDRPVVQVGHGEALPKQVHWLLLLENETPPPGFALRGRKGRFQLLERNP
ncbi:MAG TPA: hypothetical protein VGZ47_23540 [Gemmataceae bacterium]|nr:hypothetical protein [Gemmataceae bacterium]